VPRLVPKKSESVEPDFMPRLLRIAQTASDHKAEDIVAYDVRNVTLIADAFLICSAKSEPQLRAVVNSVREALKEVGIAPISVEGDTSSGWMVMDYGTVIFHVFRDTAREFYDLDGLWADAPTFELELD